MPGKQIDISSIFKQTTNFPLQIQNFLTKCELLKKCEFKAFSTHYMFLKRCYLNWGRTNDRNFFETCHSNLKSSYGCSSCIYSHFIILRGRHLSSLHSKESGSLKSDFELTTQRDSSLTKETNWLGIFSRHESFNAREEEDREALGIRLRLLMGDGDYPLEKCIYTVTGLLLPRK